MAFQRKYLSVFYLLSLPFALSAQLVTFCGRDVTDDEFTFVALTDIPAATTIYFTDGEYAQSTDDFTLQANDGVIRYTTPNDGLLEGEVVGITETALNTFSVNGSGGTAVLISNSGNFEFFQAEPLYAYNSTDLVNPENDVTEVYSLLEVSHLPISVSANPAVNYPDAIVVDFNPADQNILAADFLVSARSNTTRADFSNINNWNLSSGIGQTLALTNFSNLALPVTWLSFLVKRSENQVILEWQTASERNNFGFHIERSKDGRDWEDIGFEPGSGTTFNKQTYNWTDTELLLEKCYYRLRQEDFDGAESYSATIFVNREGNNQSIRVFPNPTADYLQIKLSNTEFSTDAHVRIIDSSGKIVLIEEINDSNSLINVSQLLRGSYCIQSDYNQTVFQSLFYKL